MQGLRQTLPQATPQAIHNAVVIGIGVWVAQNSLNFHKSSCLFLSLKDPSSKSCWIRRYLLFLHRLYRVRYVPLLLERCKNVCDTIIWEASLMLCFDPFEPRKFKSQHQDKRRDECYGCSIYSRSVPRAVDALTHTFRVYCILTSVGILTLFVLLRGLS